MWRHAQRQQQCGQAVPLGSWLIRSTALPGLWPGASTARRVECPVWSLLDVGPTCCLMCQGMSRYTSVKRSRSGGLGTCAAASSASISCVCAASKKETGRDQQTCARRCLWPHAPQSAVRARDQDEMTVTCFRHAPGGTCCREHGDEESTTASVGAVAQALCRVLRPAFSTQCAHARAPSPPCGPAAAASAPAARSTSPCQ